MMTRQKNSGQFAVGRHFAVAVMLCATVAFGDASPVNLREQHQKEIAGKSEAERARLQRNFKAFRDLPPAEQENLRRLDRELKEDARTGGNLRAIMDEYYNWLATLTPGQQQDLRAVSDPTRREIRVREFLKEQQDQADTGGAAKGNRFPPRLGSKDLSAVLGVIEEAMRERHLLTPDEIQKLQTKKATKKDLSRYVYIMELAFRPRPAGPPQGQLPWMSKDVFEAMIDGITNEKIAAQIRAGQNMERWWRLIRVIYGGIRAEYEKIKPDQDALEHFFLQLNSVQQDEIMRLPFDQQPQQLMHMYMTKMSEENPDDFPKPPQLPFWARGNRGGIRPGMRGGDEQRGGDAGGPRKSGGAGRKNMKDRPKEQKADQE
jgi:hypothetical protein